jgi:small subunit ribosomal protein S15
MLTLQEKQDLIKKYQTHENDTGSSEVQIAILTAEIAYLTDHLRTHRHDFSSRRGLLRKVNQRRKLMRYLERENLESYQTLVKSLGLKEAKKFAPQVDEAFDEAAFNAENPAE